MKRLLITASLLALFGAGCLPQTSQPLSSTPAAQFDVAGTYTNTEFGFAFDYPIGSEVHVRADDTRATSYLGMEMDFFASFRDIVRDEKPTNIFWMYATPKIGMDAFTEGLKTTGQNVEITSTEDIRFGDIQMKKIESTTDVGIPKFHFLFDQGDKTIIVSVYLEELAAAEEALSTIRTIQ